MLFCIRFSQVVYLDELGRGWNGWVFCDAGTNARSDVMHRWSSGRGGGGAMWGVGLE